MSPSPAPSVQLRIELKNATDQVRRMGVAYRTKKEAADFTVAETAALWHLIEALRLVDKCGS